MQRKPKKTNVSPKKAKTVNLRLHKARMVLDWHSSEVETLLLVDVVLSKPQIKEFGASKWSEGELADAEQSR